MRHNESVPYYTDIRAVRMERSREGTSMVNCPKWMTLGHFNWTTIEKLSDKLSSDTKVDLDGIRNQNLAIINTKTEKKSYCQPLYILREFPCSDKDKVDGFWDKKAAFMLITRVHSSIMNQLTFEETLDQRLKSYTSMATEDSLGSDVMYIRYRTLDLSDVILIMKSDSAYALLMVLGKLYTTKTIGKIYSYYCIHEDEILNLPNARLAMTSDGNIMVTIRFAVREAKCMSSFLEEFRNQLQVKENDYKRNIFFVTGTEDINVISINISSSELCTILRFLYQKIVLDNNKIFKNAADDVATRVGIPEVDLEIDSEEIRSYKEPNILSLAYGSLRTKLIKSLNGVEKKDWHRTILELTDALIEMSEDCVLRQVCFILLGAMSGVIERIYNGSVNNIDMEEELNDYLIGIAYIMEHILRMEGELVHHPETRPLLFDIPANILEFDLAFADRCARYFRNREHECTDESLRKNADKREYAFLMIPRLYTNITIHDFFNERTDDRRLLFVEIPLSLMYSPFAVACSLVHEVAHHSGEITRDRQKRIIRLCYCCALLVASNIGVIDSENTVDKIYYDLSFKVKSYLEKNEKIKGGYLSEIKQILINEVVKILRTESLYRSYINTYIIEEKLTGKKASDFYDKAYIQFKASQENVTMIESTEDDIELIVSLFSECYADIAMKSLLSLSDVDYLRLFLHQYKEFWKQQKDIEKKQSNIRHEQTKLVSLIMMIERVSLVLCAENDDVLRSLKSIADTEDDNDLRDFSMDVAMFCQEFLSQESRHTNNLPYVDEEDKGCYQPFICLDCICDYLQHCLGIMGQLDNIEKNRSEKEKIAGSFNTFAKEQRLASDKFVEEIEAYRSRLIRSTFPDIGKANEDLLL